MSFVSLICSQTWELIGLKSNKLHSPINILNDDVLLNIFHLYRLAYPDEYEDGTGIDIAWYRQRWWYKLAHVCRLWRNIILGSPSWLDLHLYCTNGVPVADMLAHSPHLPLTIDYHTSDHGREMLTAEDELGIFLALSYRDRVRHIYFWMLPNVGKFVSVMDDQFPILERMYIHSQTEEVVLPVTFQAPNLRNLTLWPASLPIGSPLLTTTAGLVALMLSDIPASAYFPPSYLLARLSLLPQLEKLSVGFKFPITNRDVEGPLHQTPDMTTLANLRWFVFYGESAYLDDIVAWITAPSLNFLHLEFFNQLSVTVPRLLQFMQTSASLRFSVVELTLDEDSVYVNADPLRVISPLDLRIVCDHLESQVASAVQIFDTLSPLLSAVEQVTLNYERHYDSSEWHSNIDRRQWRELFRPFINAKSICVRGTPVGEILRPLLSQDGEPPLELLPNLEEVEYSRGGDAQDVLTAFVDERQVAGYPVNLNLVDP
jgi:hypothetical protein